MVSGVLVILVIAVSCIVHAQDKSANYKEISDLLQESLAEAKHHVPVVVEQDGLGWKNGDDGGLLRSPPQKRSIFYHRTGIQPRYTTVVRRNYLRFGKRGSPSTDNLSRVLAVPTNLSDEERENIKLRNFVNFFKQFQLVPGHTRDDNLVQTEKWDTLSKRANDYIRFGKRAQDYIRFGKRAQDYIRFGKRAQDYIRFGKRAQDYIRFGKKADREEVPDEDSFENNSQNAELDEEEDEGDIRKYIGQRLALCNQTLPPSVCNKMQKRMDYIRFGRKR